MHFEVPKKIGDAPFGLHFQSSELWIVISSFNQGSFKVGLGKLVVALSNIPKSCQSAALYKEAVSFLREGRRHGIEVRIIDSSIGLLNTPNVNGASTLIFPPALLHLAILKCSLLDAPRKGSQVFVSIPFLEEPFPTLPVGSELPVNEKVKHTKLRFLLSSSKVTGNIPILLLFDVGLKGGFAIGY